MMEFIKSYNMGILGEQPVEVSYDFEGYKVYDFECWMFDFPYGGKATEITGFLIDGARDMIYDDCCRHLADWYATQAEMIK